MLNLGMRPGASTDNTGIILSQVKMPKSDLGAKGLNIEESQMLSSSRILNTTRQSNFCTEM